MKLVTYQDETLDERLGFYIDGKIADLENEADKYGISLPSDILDLLDYEEDGMNDALEVYNSVLKNGFDEVEPVAMLAPVPYPTSCRDGYAFRQHVEAARKNRGVEMIPEFDEFPIFYFTNHNAIFGEGEIEVESDHFHKLDFELEIAIVIGKHGKNIPANEADEYIAGFMIMNDWSARLLQMEEMKLNLGPAKGKDFATSIGPWLVTPEELEPYKIESKYGNRYNLKMTAKHNGKLVSEGNAKDMTFTFAEIIERASYGVDLFPGDVIGSGTVGTGCYLELNGTWAREAKDRREDFTPIWIENGDEIELTIDGLGTLKNTIVKSEKDYSILSKKKK